MWKNIQRPQETDLPVSDFHVNSHNNNNFLIQKTISFKFYFIIFNSNYGKFYDIKLEAKASRLACISSEIKWYFALPRTSQSHTHSRIPSVTEQGAWALTSPSHSLRCSDRANLDKRSLLVCSHHKTPNTTLNSQEVSQVTICLSSLS